MYPMIAIRHPANARPARCFNLSEMYATVKVVAEAAIKIGITIAWICFVEYVGLRTLTIVGENKVHE